MRPIQNLALAFLPAAILVLFLCYIDEGLYSFRWMFDWGNWIVFVIYTLVLVPVFWLMMQFMFRSQTGIKKALLVSAVGVPLILVVLFGWVF